MSTAMEANYRFFLFVIWCLRSAVGGQHEECVQDDYVQNESQTSSNLPPVEKDPVQFGDDHAGKIIRSVRVDIG